MILRTKIIVFFSLDRQKLKLLYNL